MSDYYSTEVNYLKKAARERALEDLTLRVLILVEALHSAQERVDAMGIATNLNHLHPQFSVIEIAKMIRNEVDHHSWTGGEGNVLRFPAVRARRGGPASPTG